jgi:hypothetical protein
MLILHWKPPLPIRRFHAHLALDNSHVRHCPHQRPRLGILVQRHCCIVPGHSGPLHQFRHSEIEDFQLALFRHHDVRRLEVAMDDVCTVGCGQRVGRLRGVLEQVGQPHVLCSDQRGQRAAAHPLHDHIVDAALGADIVNRNDVWMVQSGRSLGFLHEAALALQIGDTVRRKDLNSDNSVQPGVVGFVHLTHSSLPD